MTSTNESWPTHHLFDVRIDAARSGQVLEAIDQAIQLRQRLLIGVVNCAKMVAMRDDPSLRRAVLGADMILADGMSIVWACRMFGRRLPERVTGIDLMAQMLARGSQRGYRIYCLGATEEVLANVKTRIAQEFPGVKLVGTRNGYFSEADEEAIALDIAAAKPDILFVGISSPKKERFLAKWMRIMDVPVCHGVGGAFDVMSGKVRRAPQAWQRFGLEWLYRVGQEPRRMWKRYLTSNTRFVGMLAGEAGRAMRRRVWGEREQPAAQWHRVRTSHHH